MSPDPGISSLTQPRALLLDWDGTLVNTHPVLAAAMNVTLEKFGLPVWSYADWAVNMGPSARDRFPALFGERWEEARKVYLDAYEEQHLNKLECMTGADAFIEAMASAPVYAAVVSNKTGPILRRESDHLGWTPHFGRIIGANDAARDKPAPEPALMALEPSGFRAGPEVWLIGDNAVDVACGRAAGCTTILIGEGAPEAAPDLRLPDLAALSALVVEL